MTTNANRLNPARRRISPGLIAVALAGGAIVVLGAGRASQDTQRVNRLELLDAEGRVAMVLNVTDDGRPQLSIIEGDQATLIEFSTTEMEIVTPQPAAEGEQPQIRMSTLRFDALHALAGAGPAEAPARVRERDEATDQRLRELEAQIDALRIDVGQAGENETEALLRRISRLQDSIETLRRGQDQPRTDEVESMTLRMRYLQEQIDTLRREQRERELERQANEPTGRDVRDPLRLQRVIDDLQRELRDLESDLSRRDRDIDDLERRVRTIEMKIRGV